MAQALAQYCTATEPGQALPAGLLEDSNRPLCREWLRRMRVYSAQAIHALNGQFDTQRMFTAPFALGVQGRMAEHGLLLPPMPEGEALWQWHRQQLFMLARLEQPSRWLALIDPALPGQLHYPDEHPFASAHAMLLGHTGGGLLGSLDRRDPLQAMIAARMATLPYALDSARLPDAALLLECLDNDDGSVQKASPLSYVLLCTVLYHDRSLDETARASLRERLEALELDGDWFGAWRNDVLAGKLRLPPYRALHEHGIDKRVARLLMEALEALFKRCTPPSTATLRALQKIKDNPPEYLGLRCAIMALLGWSERMLVNDLQQPPAPAWAFWKLNSRLDRKGFAGHLLGIGLGAALLKVLPAMMLVIAVLIISGSLRRLRDMGQGVPLLALLLVLSRVLPFVPLVLLVLPGDKLPNRYGAVPGAAEQLEGGLQATLRRLDAQ